MEAHPSVLRTCMLEPKGNACSESKLHLSLLRHPLHSLNHEGERAEIKARLLATTVRDHCKAHESIEPVQTSRVKIANISRITAVPHKEIKSIRQHYTKSANPRIAYKHQHPVTELQSFRETITGSTPVLNSQLRSITSHKHLTIRPRVKIANISRITAPQRSQVN
ncbi:hypothetical protein BJ508DRAFT_22952 [Ascobolus immersus RN42]|uniref:Uncharacterized protein n=1 Tax=Ascobolus immersus RN42 TaxID=1160509 RepID=A0A3N4HN42_ASCIM|nr:hypothetical protein BJ508DRAFT_22952 [Ascobolus immersus RN42]